jgi:predicted anti-sigma-YlaC factor YlaD
MRCDRFREAISARIDGEDPGLPDGVLDAHLRACADCRAWQQRAHVATRHARLGGLFPDHDLTPRVLAAVPAAATGRRRRITQRAGLAAVAIAQFAITVPCCCSDTIITQGLTRPMSSARSTCRWPSRSPSVLSAQRSRPALPGRARSRRRD